MRPEIASFVVIFVFSGQKSFLVLCMMTFPAWFLLLFIVLGVIELPFDIPGLDNLLMWGVSYYFLLLFLSNYTSCRHRKMKSYSICHYWNYLLPLFQFIFHLKLCATSNIFKFDQVYRKNHLYLQDQISFIKISMNYVLIYGRCYYIFSKHLVKVREV